MIIINADFLNSPFRVDDDLTKQNHQNCLILIVPGESGLSQIQDIK